MQLDSQGTPPAHRPPQPESTFRAHLGPLLFFTGIFFLNFCGRIIFSPLMPTVEKDLGLVHAQAGGLFFLISCGYFGGLLGSGFLSSRLFHRTCIALSAATTGVVLLFVSVSGTLWEIRLALVFLGMAAGIYLPSGMATLTHLIEPRHWGKAIAVHEMAPNWGFVAAPLIAELFLGWTSWRTVPAFLGACSLLMGLGFWKRGRGGEFKGDRPNFSSVRILAGTRAFWIMILLFGLGISSTMGIFTMLPLYLVTEHGIDRGLANTLVGLSRIPGVGMAFFAGWVSDRLGPARTMAGALLLTGAATVLLGLGPGSWILVLVFVQPVLGSCFFPPGFAAISSVAPARARGMAVSMTVPAAFLIGGGVIPTGIGLMADLGSFSLGLGLLGLVIGGLGLLSLSLPLPVKEQGQTRP